MILVLADARHWFGTEWIRTGWVIFDLAMVAVFLLLGSGAIRTPTRTYAVALISLGAVLLDLLLTVVQVVQFHLLRSTDRFEVTVAFLALLGPLLAAIYFLGLSVSTADSRK